MLKGLNKQEDKEEGKTKYEAARSINHKATQNKNNAGTTALEQDIFFLVFKCPYTVDTLYIKYKVSPYNQLFIISNCNRLDTAQWHLCLQTRHLF